MAKWMQWRDTPKQRTKPLTGHGYRQVVVTQSGGGQGRKLKQHEVFP